MECHERFWRNVVPESVGDVAVSEHYVASCAVLQCWVTDITRCGPLARL
ncbi:hypothetical protein OKW29_000903 [Paraburkholderia sp. CI3]